MREGATGLIAVCEWCLGPEVGVFIPSLQPLALLFPLPATPSLVSGTFTCTESPEYEPNSSSCYIWVELFTFETELS